MPKLPAWTATRRVRNDLAYTEYQDNMDRYYFFDGRFYPLPWEEFEKVLDEAKIRPMEKDP